MRKTLTGRVDAGADKDAAAYYVRAMEKSQEKGDWFKRLGFRDYSEYSDLALGEPLSCSWDHLRMDVTWHFSIG